MQTIAQTARLSRDRPRTSILVSVSQSTCRSLVGDEGPIAGDVGFGPKQLKEPRGLNNLDKAREANVKERGNANNTAADTSNYDNIICPGRQATPGSSPDTFKEYSRNTHPHMDLEQIYENNHQRLRYAMLASFRTEQHLFIEIHDVREAFLDMVFASKEATERARAYSRKPSKSHTTSIAQHRASRLCDMCGDAEVILIYPEDHLHLLSAPAKFSRSLSQSVWVIWAFLGILVL